jgi:hypothetical protein
MSDIEIDLLKSKNRQTEYKNKVLRHKVKYNSERLNKKIRELKASSKEKDNEITKLHKYIRDINSL